MSYGANVAVALVLAGLVLGGPSAAEEPRERVLVPLDTLKAPGLGESSGLVLSRRLPGVFWSHNDSGDEARLFALDSTGASIRPPWTEADTGLRVLEAANHDWEDLALGDAGNLILADVGNNSNARRDLCLYVVPEPDPRRLEAARPVTRILVAWPDQTEFPAPDMNRDCEAIFFARGAVHFLTKHRTDRLTRLYRLDPPAGVAGDPHRPWHEAFRPGRVHALTYLGEADVGGLREDVAGLVTAADADLDGGRLVLLTYTGLFLVENPPEGEGLRTGNLLAGRWSWLPLAAGQCEAVALDGDRVWITNEQRGLHQVPLRELAPR